MKTLEEISKMLNYFLVEHNKPKQTTNVVEYYEEFEEWRNEMLALKPELSEEYFIDGFNFGLDWNIQMKLKGFRSPPMILYEAYLRAKIEESVMEKHDSTLDSPKEEQLMKENEVIEAEHNDIITNLKDESVVSHMFDELCQRTPMDFLEENQHKTSAREYQEEKAINQMFDRLAHNDCVISQGLSYELLTGELGWQQGSIDKEIFNSASPLHCPRNWSSVSSEVKQKFTEVKINWNQLSCSGYRFGNCSSCLKSMLSSKLVKMDNDEQKPDGAVNIVPSQQNRPLDGLIFDPGGSTKIEMNKDCNDSKFGAVSMQGIFYIAIVEHVVCLIQGLPKLSKDCNPNVAVDEYCSVSSFWIVKNTALGVKKDANAFIFVFNPGEVILLENFSNGQLKYVQECSFKLLERRCPQKGEVEKCTTVIYGVCISIWQLSTLAICGHQSKIVIMEVGESELLNEKSSQSLLWCSQIDFSKDNSRLVCGVLPAIVFQDMDILQVHAPVKAISVLANFLELKETTNRYFGLQFLAGLACNGYIGILLSISNLGVPAGLLTLLGCVDANMQDLLKAVEKFLGLHYPDQVALKRLYMVGGATSRILTLVAQLKLIPGPDFGSDGQFRTLKVVNILEPQGLADHQSCELPIPLLDSFVSDMQKLVAELLLHVLMEDQSQKNQQALPFSYTTCLLRIAKYQFEDLFGSLELCLTSLRTRIV